jgi:pyruvate kinase
MEENNFTDAESLKVVLESLITRMAATVENKSLEIERLHPDQKLSAINLIQYLTLRNEDVRILQDRLHVAGLSSLTNSESHILRQIQAILERLGKNFGLEDISPCDYFKGRDLINSRSMQLFGTKKDPTIPYLMVTFDTTFVDNYQLVQNLLEGGMNVARINCAHDNMEIWKNMIDLVRNASAATGIDCKIYMDIAGPKLRTSILSKGKLINKVTLFLGQEILLAENSSDYDPVGTVIGCDEPGVVNQLKAGERILFDDGLIEAKVLSVGNGTAVLKILRISRRKPQLKSFKGMNFPDSRLSLASLTEDDRLVLPFICEHADLAGYSFIRQASDLNLLHQELAKYDKKPKIILKIETSDAVKNFPALLMKGMTQEVFGVMIARGDLAVEIGFERLSEIQEEILWISEAGHVPVIWATQVLETLNKSGIATRSEITDATYAAQSECVLINKGNYVINVLKSLTDILRRSGGHHVKKRYTFRPMQIASNYLKS